ncbi:hypothetical protein [uncultured Ruegeria sp.]|uniref:hypothetical protein n=1 Tax=uncultured Ruegeria sp. TaxID=259304 RepID=UPI00261692FB|nr:hypothetical protein [uncultured Ruegeria sp.]
MTKELPHTIRFATAKTPTEGEIFSQILHPGWSSAADRALLASRAANKSLFEIAQQTGRSTTAVTQRYHRLRSVPNIEKLLEAHGEKQTPYDPEEDLSGLRTTE